ncbi:hypothetical protein ACFZDG_26255 [Kitasatospora xanthocidica]|uniref:hypothetical protein n=1 Tax=Kitasatospora xanthocidica TaxID=83382 RepID=UPI0036E86E02
MKSRTRMARLVALGVLAASATVLPVGAASASTGPTGGGGVYLGRFSEPECYKHGQDEVDSHRYSQFSCARAVNQWGNTWLYDLWVA